jgi:protochlorophyllide reductase
MGHTGVLPTNEIFHVAESVSGGGDCLAYMVEAPDLPKAVYYNNDLDFEHGFGKHAFKETAVSEEAMDDAKAARLWELSAAQGWALPTG